MNERYRMDIWQWFEEWQTKVRCSNLTFLKFGDSFNEWTWPWSSPAIIIGSTWLKQTWVSFALLTTFCSQSGSCLFSDKSKTWTCWIQWSLSERERLERKFEVPHKSRKCCIVYASLHLSRLTFPSLVTAANTVEEYGAQATPPTALPILTKIGGMQINIKYTN